MPGLIAFRRRWSVGSDDFVVAGAALATFHCICTIMLICSLCLIDFSSSDRCVLELWIFNIVYLSITALSLGLEIFMSCVSLKGSILNTEPRSAVKYILYVKLVILIVEISIHIYGVYWICVNYDSCPVDYGKTVFLVLVVLNWFTVVGIFFHIWCAYDPVGRKWVKMKEYQMKESESKYQFKRSSNKRNWRQRKVMRAYQDSWDQRCRLLLCCMRATDSNRNSFRDIARLLSEYFRDVDVVPSDIIAGIILLRVYQKIERRAIIEQRKNDTYQFLSGVPVTSNTRFLSLQDDGSDVELFQRVIRYVYFAVRAYGWPMYVMTKRMGLCNLCSSARCCCFLNLRSDAEVVEDNCCHLNRAALNTLSELGNIEVIYATYHVDVGKTPFFVALDFDKEKVVISIRGTLSIQDILTDLDAGAEHIPVEPLREDWLGHKGMVSAAQYILETIKEERLLEQAHEHNVAMGTKNFGLVIVGHSLGAGIASILGILLRMEYPDLTCYCYSPPGGLLSMAAMEYTKAFTTSVVLGKDVVPRLGLSQMYTLKADLRNALKRSVDPKWKIISCGMVCCCCAIEPTSATELSTADQAMSDYINEKRLTRGAGGICPSESSTAPSSEQPMYPPGRIVHVVRHHPTKDDQKYEKTWRKALSANEPVYQAIWAENTDFDEVLISPVMIQDHMPDKLLTALNKVVRTFGPRKPRRSTEVSPNAKLHNQQNGVPPPAPSPDLQPHNNSVYMETSFTTFTYNNNNNVGINTISSEVDERMNEERLCRHDEDDDDLESLSTYVIVNADVHMPTFDSNKNIALPNGKTKMWAPLAVPESFSDTSSTTSSGSNVELRAASASAVLRAPQMMRRTPRIIGSLSTCTDDIRNVKSFERLLKGGASINCHHHHHHPHPMDNSNSSSNLSYASSSNKTDASSNDYEHFVGAGQCSWQREEPPVVPPRPPSAPQQPPQSDEIGTISGRCSALAEELLEEILEYAECAEYFKSNSSFLLDGYDDKLETESDIVLNCDSSYNRRVVPTIKLTKSTNTATSSSSPLILSPSSLEIDPDVISNYAIDLNLEQEHRSLLSHQSLQTSILKVNAACNGSKTPPPPPQQQQQQSAKTVTFSPDVLSVDERLLFLEGGPGRLEGPQKSSSRIWNFVPFRFFRKAKAPTAANSPDSAADQILTLQSGSDGGGGGGVDQSTPLIETCECKRSGAE